MQYFNKVTGWLLTCLVMVSETGVAGSASGFGSIANNIFQPLKGVASIVKVVCIVAGAGLIVSAFIKFIQHRKNPVEVTLGSCIALLVAGIALLILAFIPMPTVRR